MEKSIFPVLIHNSKKFQKLEIYSNSLPHQSKTIKISNGTGEFISVMKYDYTTCTKFHFQFNITKNDKQLDDRR